MRYLVQIAAIRPQIRELITRDHPQAAPDSHVCHTDLDHYRSAHVRRVLEEQVGETSRFDEAMLAKLTQHEAVAAPVDTLMDRRQDLGARVADRVATFGGSWTFISIFGVVLVAWMTLNTVMLQRGAFDPYPYILLNLILSCLAAIQAPVIMMSQNRQESRDRQRAENDYLVNVKAELEVRLLHEKLDHLLHHQWERLLEIQEIQIEMMGRLGSLPPER